MAELKLPRIVEKALFAFVSRGADDRRDPSKPVGYDANGNALYGTAGPVFRFRDFSDLAPPPDDGRFE